MPTILSERTSIHSDLLKQKSPDWLIKATPTRRIEIKDTRATLPDWYQRASIEQQETLRERFSASFMAQTRLDQTMSTLQDVDTFAEPLLAKALKDQFNIELNVNRTLLCLRRPLAVGVFEIELTSFEVMKLTLLQAALHNFEEAECEDGAFHRDSAFVLETSTPGTFDTINVNMTIRQFLSLCRTLDIGAQYQTYLKAFLQRADAQKEATLRQQFIVSQKAALRAAAELALLKKDIEPEDYSMILAVINDEVHPRLGDRQVWFRDLSLMKRRMIGCVVFSISERNRYTVISLSTFPMIRSIRSSVIPLLNGVMSSNASSRPGMHQRLIVLPRPLTSAFSASSWLTPTVLTTSASSRKNRLTRQPIHYAPSG